MAFIRWQVSPAWAAADIATRTALYPAFYLRRRHEVSLHRGPATAGAGATHLVLVAARTLAPQDLQALAEASAAAVPAIVLAPEGLAPEALEAVLDCGAIAAGFGDTGPLASAPPGRAVAAPGLAARLAENMWACSVLDLAARCGEASVAAGDVLVLADTSSDVARLSDVISRAGQGGRRRVVVGVSGATGPQDGRHVVDLAHLGPSDFARAGLVLCAMGGRAVDSPEPGLWVRTALLAGAPVVAQSHPALDGLADLCVMDDWDRGLSLLACDASFGPLSGARAQRELSRRLAPESVAQAWESLLEQDGRSRHAAGSAPRGRPVLLIGLDLIQEIDVVLPLLTALMARGALTLQVTVTDWLARESPRTLRLLQAHGITPQVEPRAAVRRGEAPSLDGVDGVLCACDASVGPHRAGRRTIERAKAAGLATFSLQHGFENIGLNYRDAEHGADIDFAAETVFVWGQAEALPDWVAAETRTKVLALGCPKAAPAAAAPASLSLGEWRRRIGIFENLHWERYDETYRAQLLADLSAVATASPDVLFLVKPHHAGRWLVKNADRLPRLPNVVLLDPTDPAWEPFTAPAIIAGADAVLTTPSTVALDAVRAGRSVAVFGYGLDLSAYAPLPAIGGRSDLEVFLAEAPGRHLARNEAFLARAMLPGCADHRIAAAIEARLLARGR